MNAATVPWIILFTPLVAAAVILFFGRYSKPFSAGLAIGATLLCGILSWWLFTQPDATEPNQFFWINLPDIFSVPIGVTVDHLSKVMLVVVNTIAPLVFIYSLGDIITRRTPPPTPASRPFWSTASATSVSCSVF